jgi:hypothetical protein
MEIVKKNLKPIILGLIIIPLIALFIILFIFWNTQPSKKSEYFAINDFTTNKFLYPAGPISNKDCNLNCERRLKKCNSYFTPSGGINNWCTYDYNKCKQTCNWNSIF